MLTLAQLKFEMRDYAAVFSAKKVDDNKPLKTYLHGGSGTATPQHIFKSFIRYILQGNGHKLKSWPENWPNLSINSLAPKLL